MSHRSAKRRRGYTLMEMVVSMSSATLLMTGLASALVIATSSFNLDSGKQSKTGTAARVQADLMADLQHALSFSERTATAVTFTVPDRDNDTFPETIRYAWSGTLGDPLTYQYNGGTVVNLAEDVQSFDLSYLTRTMIPFNCSAPTFEEFTETSVGYDGYTVTVSKPPGTMEGDLLIAAVAVHKDNADYLDAPAGWTSVTGPHNEDHATLGVWWKIAGASESSSYTFDWYGGDDEEAYGWIMRFTGHDPDSPIEDSAYSLNGDSTSPASPAVTTTTENTLILRLGAFHNDDINTDDPGLSGHTAITMDGNGSISGGAGYVVQAGIGSSGTSNFTQTASQESATITLAITGAGCSDSSSTVESVLFVVADSSSLSSQESARQSQLQSWGYTVNLISDGASQATFDAALAVNDVVYFSEEMDSGSLSTKVRNASIGVVSGEPYMIDETGFASSFTLPTITSIDVTNGSHYITSEFGTGSLTILSSSNEGQCASGTLAGGLSTLAEIDDGGTDRPALATLDTGDSLYGGGTAAARRVQLPWGGTSFDFSALNSDGLTLLKRSLEWAAGAGDDGAASVVEYHEFTENSVTDATSVTVSKPSGTANGDLLLAAIATEKDRVSSISPPSGWTLVAKDNFDDKATLAIYWKTAGGSEPSSYNFSWSSNSYAYGWIMRLTGHDTSGPIDASSISVNNSTSSPTSPAVITTVNNAMVIRMGAFVDGAGVTDDTGLSGHTTITVDGNSKVDGGAGYVLQSSSGSSGTSSFSLAESKESVTITIAIKPSP